MRNEYRRMTAKTKKAKLAADNKFLEFKHKPGAGGGGGEGAGAGDERDGRAGREGKIRVKVREAEGEATR